jgi:hypothetical protein
MKHQKGDIVRVKGFDRNLRVGAVGDKVQIKTPFGSDVGYFDHADVTHVHRPKPVKPVKGSGETIFAPLKK